LAKLRLRALAPSAGSAVAYHFGEPRFTNLYAGADAVLGGAGPSQIVVGQPAQLLGRVLLQGRPAPPHARWVQSLSVELRDAATDAVLQVRAVTTNNEGRFTVGGLTPGAYTVRVKGMHTLANRAAGVTLAVGDNALSLGTLREGDVDNDNDVDAADASLLNAAFGSAPGGDRWDPRADLNGDAVVDGGDYGLLAGSYGLSGDQPAVGASSLAVVPELTGAAAPAWPLRVAPLAGNVGLGFQPTELGAEGGEILTVQLKLYAGDQPVDTVDVTVSFPSASLKLVDAGGHPVSQVQAGSSFSVVLANAADNATGRLHLAATQPGGALTGEMTLATLRFKAVAPAPNGLLRFAMYDPRCDVWYRGESVLGSWPAATVHVAGQSRVNVALVVK